MNTALLLKVKAAILAEPLKFDMSMWFLNSEQSPCGTTACIAGHAIAISRRWKKLKSGQKMEDQIIQDMATSVLDLDQDSAYRLFGASYWPYQFRHDYYNSFGAKKRAKVAAKRIDHFIATNGAE